jgi:hypothetical protein
LTGSKPSNAAVDPNDLAPEDRETYLKQLGLKPELVDGPIEQPEHTPKKQNKEPKNFMSSISEQAGKDLVYYAQFEKYDFEMDDGTVKKYYRVSPTQYEWDELEDLRAEVEGGEAMDDGHKLNKREHRLKTKLLEQLKAKYYLRNAKTNKPMSNEEHAHIKNSSKVGSILDSSVIVGLHKAVQGKK